MVKGLLKDVPGTPTSTVHAFQVDDPHLKRTLANGKVITKGNTFDELVRILGGVEGSMYSEATARRHPVSLKQWANVDHSKLRFVVDLRLQITGRVSRNNPVYKDLHARVDAARKAGHVYKMPPKK